MIEIKTFVFNPFLENTYVLHDETGECVIIDPGCYEKYEQDQLKDYIESNNLKVVKLLNTHCHIDHVFGNYWVKTFFKVDLFVHPIDEATLKAVKAYAPSYGFQHYQEASVDQYLKEGDIVKFGNSALEVIFVPGHAPGHVAFINKNQGFCIGGDVLFEESIGRTDLPGGDFDTLMHSIKTKMFTLPDNTTVYPGHGATTTIGHEKMYNPFCRLGN